MDVQPVHQHNNPARPNSHATSAASVPLQSGEFDRIWVTANIFFSELVQQLGLTREQLAVDVHRRTTTVIARALWEQYYSKTWMAYEVGRAVGGMVAVAGPVLTTVMGSASGDTLALQVSTDPRAFGMIQLGLWGTFETGAIASNSTLVTLRKQLGSQ